MSNQLDSLVPIETAARRVNLPISMLRGWIEAGKIKAAMYGDALLVSEADLMASVPKEERPEYLKFASLRGHGISSYEAERKYGVRSATISRWYRSGYIAKIGEQGAQKILLDEADVAYCVEIYRKNPGQGKRVFDRDGNPYRAKN